MDKHTIIIALGYMGRIMYDTIICDEGVIDVKWMIYLFSHLSVKLSGITYKSQNIASEIACHGYYKGKKSIYKFSSMYRTHKGI